ncbi:MAG: 16S rRNA (cytosine(1402)-N(4))-methyltransferase RsmH [Desulfotignum sp.]|jgi:16S rRNA (cytosine1402-N4)-methyltransferase|nr:16S rRNA (cytosine(1402)-N(4))-methyltransferase RsmH [Desulfotignum sp.]
MGFVHTSVMPAEVLAYQNLKPGDVCVDCTLGGAGHAESSIKAILPGGTLIGIDQDHEAIANAKKVLHRFTRNIILVHDNFSRLPKILDQHNISGVNSIVLDLGFSLNQITQARRGFSFNLNEPLDMRMDIRNDQTAETIVNSFGEKELADLFFRFGEEKFSRRIARAIVRDRQIHPIATTQDLTRIICDTVPKGRAAAQKIHPATRVFQALRIAVNQELENLAMFMQQVPDLLVTGGRICVICFHSLEDRIVKQHLKSFEALCTCPKDLPQCVCNAQPTMKSIFKKPLIPSPGEMAANPMARSAKLRVAERI